MAMPFLNHTHTSLNLEKIDNKNSIWAFILSMFVYVSLFYIFNLSPSTLVHTTKFWFILSNTLILIIAADSGAFSFSKNLDFFDQLAKNDVRSSEPPPTLIPYFHIKHHKTTSLSSKHHAQLVLVDDEHEPPEKIIGVVATHQTLNEKPLIPITDRDINIEAGKTDDRNSRVKKIMEEEEEEIATEKADDDVAHEEFSRMSDEELNTRVEEFIRRVNRQIRLQAAIIPP